MMLALWHAPIYTEGIDPGARFPRERYRLVRQSLETGATRERFAFRHPQPVAIEDLRLVHESSYVDAFLHNTLPEEAMRRIGLRPWTGCMVERTLVLTGGTVEAVHHVLENGGIAGNVGGGTHHAYRDFGSGYCIFNDLAVAAAVARRDHGVDRILVLDLDVHQGDGTAALFASDAGVRTVSLHCGENFPFRKMMSDHDEVLDAGSGDGTYLAALDRVLEHEAERDVPGLLLFQAGVDGLATDRLGRLALTREGLRRRNERVYRFARERGIPTVITMGGGYGDPLETSIAAHADVFRQAVEADEGEKTCA